MAERSLTQILSQLQSQTHTLSYSDAAALLSKAKLLLRELHALIPTPAASPQHLGLARATYEQGALYTIRARNADAFTRYVAQLQPFYELPAAVLAPEPAERSRITGLYLLLLLTQGRYAEFHSELEGLEARTAAGGSGSGSGNGDAGVEVESDKFLGYPIRLERWLMEGSYDRVWKAMKQGEVPCEEYGVFSEILTSQIRSEIASSSERAYPSLPLSSTKSLLFLDSEGAVVEFAHQRGWIVRDGHIYFPTAAKTGAPSHEVLDGEDASTGLGGVGAEKEMSQMVIENTLGYTRDLETIV